VIGAAPGIDAALAQRLEALGARAVSVEFERTGVNPLQDLRGLWRLWRMLRRERPDVALAYTVKPAIYGSLAARLAACSSASPCSRAWATAWAAAGRCAAAEVDRAQVRPDADRLAGQCSTTLRSHNTSRPPANGDGRRRQADRAELSSIT
jgi:Glycosyl transferase 4-like